MKVRNPRSQAPKPSPQSKSKVSGCWVGKNISKEQYARHGMCLLSPVWHRRGAHLLQGKPKGANQQTVPPAPPPPPQPPGLQIPQKDFTEVALCHLPQCQKREAENTLHSDGREKLGASARFWDPTALHVCSWRI